jgi:hypothetical protein
MTDKTTDQQHTDKNMKEILEELMLSAHELKSAWYECDDFWDQVASDIQDDMKALPKGQVPPSIYRYQREIQSMDIPQPSNENMKTKQQKHVFCFNPEDNGGEQLLATIEVIDGCPYVEIELNSYDNVASITTNTITPDKLRKLADEMDALIKSESGQ